MAMDGLQRVADTGLGMTVIGDQRGDRRLLGPRGERRQKGRRPRAASRRWRRRPSSSRSDAGTASRRRALPHRRRRRRASPSVTQRSRHAPSYAHDLPDGKGIDEFVGDEDERAVRHVFDRLAPVQRGRGDRAASRAATSRKHGAGLDQGDGECCRGVPAPAPKTRSASAIKRAAPRPELGDDHRGGLAHGLPDRGRPDADQLAEHLADLRRGDEIAVFADRLPRGVIAARADRRGRSAYSRAR